VAEFTGSASASFSAGHIIKDHPRCGRSHGHRWTVTVTIKAGQDPASGELLGLPELAEAVASLAAELDRESLNEMVPGAQPTPAGLALAWREQLAMHFRAIVEIRVDMDEVSATLHA